MFRAKAAKGFIIGLGLAMALSTAVYAEEMQEEVFSIQITSVAEQPGEVAPDTPVSSDGQVLMPADSDETAVSGFAEDGAGGSSGTGETAAADGQEANDADMNTDVARTLSAPVEDRIYMMTSDAVSDQAQQTASTALIPGIAAAAVILLGGFFLTSRRMKTVKR